jgi:hypothetical protein
MPPPPPITPPPVTPPAVPPPPGSAQCPFPRCLVALLTPCTPAGTCTRQTTTIGNNICYANGVKYIPALGNPNPTPSLALRVFRPDGRACYVLEAGARPGGGGMGATASLTYRNPNGAVVATGTVTQGNTLVLTCPNEPTAMVPISCQPGLFGLTAPNCTPGMCM